MANEKYSILEGKLKEALNEIEHLDSDEGRKCLGFLQQIASPSSTMVAPTVAPAAPVAPRKSRIRGNGGLGGNLKKAVAALGVATPAEIGNKLLEMGVPMAFDETERADYVREQLKKSRKTVYREYPEDRWGLFKQPKPKIVPAA